MSTKDKNKREFDLTGTVNFSDKVWKLCLVGALAISLSACTSSAQYAGHKAWEICGKAKMNMTPEEQRALTACYQSVYPQTLNAERQRRAIIDQTQAIQQQQILIQRQNLAIQQMQQQMQQDRALPPHY